MSPAAWSSATLDLDSHCESSQEVPMSYASTPVKREVPTSKANVVKKEPVMKTLPVVAPDGKTDKQDSKQKGNGN